MPTLDKDSVKNSAHNSSKDEVTSKKGAKDQDNLVLSSEIQKLIEKAQEEKVRIDNNFTDLKNSKQALLFQIAHLRMKEKDAVKNKLKEETLSIRREIREAQVTIDKINDVLKNKESFEDHKKIQSIIKDWYGEKRELGKENARLDKAEKALENVPWDRHLQGESNRARAEISETKRRLEKIALEAKLAEEKSVINPVRDESIATYTYDQSVADHKKWVERHKKTKAEEATAKVVEQIVSTEPQKPTTPVVVVEHPELHSPYYKAIERIKVENSLALVPQNHEGLLPLSTPYIKLIPYRKKTDSLAKEKKPYVVGTKKDDGSLPSDTKAPKHQEGKNYVKIFRNFMSNLFSTTEKTPVPKSKGDAVLPTEPEKTLSTLTSKSTESVFNKPLLTEFTYHEEPAKKVFVESSPDAKKVEEPIITKVEEVIHTSEIIPQEILPEPTPTKQEELIKPTPQEIIAKPIVLIQAEEQIREVIKQIWGKDGILGIGSSDGMDTFRIFANIAVEEILKMTPNIWINKDAQYLINEAHKQTNVAWTPNETFEEYLKRATATAIDRITKKE